MSKPQKGAVARLSLPKVNSLPSFFLRTCTLHQFRISFFFVQPQTKKKLDTKKEEEEEDHARNELWHSHQRVAWENWQGV